MNNRNLLSSAKPLTRPGPIELWRQAFGEPPPITAGRHVMAEIIKEYATHRGGGCNAGKWCDGHRR